jgi:glycosyltransferase involved in cell wall biosynthesis
MRVLHINSTDAVGGAAAAAWRLHQTLLSRGVDSRMLVERKTTNDPSVFEMPVPDFRRGFWKPVEAGAVWRNRTPLSDTYFSSGYPGVDISGHPEVRQAEILHFHWVTDFLSPPSVAALTQGAQPVIWTLHDQRPLTGGCHFSAGCEGYADGCAPCPQLRSQIGGLPARNLADAGTLYRSGQVTLVSPSRWMDRCARASQIFPDAGKVVIPYGIPRQTFQPMDRGEARRELGIRADGFYVLFGAAALSERRKGAREFLEAAKLLLRNTEVQFLVFGDKSEFLSELGSALVPLGFLRGPEQLRRAYAAADVFALASLEDNLPNTMLEAMACGTPVVGFNVGGVPDAVRPGITGQLVEKGDVEGFAQALLSYAGDTESARRHGDAAASMVEREFSLDLQADRYMALYSGSKALPAIAGAIAPVLGPSLSRGLPGVLAGALLNLAVDVGARILGTRSPD